MNSKSILLFLVLFVTIAVNLPTGMFAGFGFQPNLVLAFFIALGVTAAIKEAHLGMTIVVVVLTALANLPVEDYVEFGFDRDIIITALVVLVISPIIYHFFD